MSRSTHLSLGRRGHTPSRRVTLRTAAFESVKKCERIAQELFAHDGHDIPRLHEARRRVSNAPFALKIPRSQPFIGQREALTAVVVLHVIDPHRPAVLDHRAVLRHGVGYLRKDLSEMDGRILAMPDPEEQDLSVELVHAADRALGTVRWQREWIGRASCRERVCSTV